MVKGIDISKYQGDIDFSKVKNDVDFVIIRAGYTGYGSGTQEIDSKFYANIQGCESNKIPFGVYWFSQATNIQEAEAEAETVYSLIKDHKLQYPIFIDTEMSGAPNNTGRADSLTKEMRTKIVKAFCEKIESYGYYSGFYCSRSWLTSNLNAGELAPFDLWLADWNDYGNDSYPSAVHSYGIWQFTSFGSCAGVNGRVDMNYAFKDYPNIMIDNNLNGYGKDNVQLEDIMITDLSSGDVENFKNLAKELKVEDNFRVI